MKARPILFSGPMILALLAGTKTQTRRKIKPQPFDDSCAGQAMIGHRDLGGTFAPHVFGSCMAKLAPCPCGAIGDLVYVKEAWRTSKCLDDLDATTIAEKCLDAGYRKPWTPMRFEADGYQCSTWRGFGSGHEIAVPGRYRHARFMPRWVSRLTLRITEVRVQRLQEISSEDCFAEGTPGLQYPQPPGGYCSSKGGPVRAYRQLWEEINGAGSWSANPWVWCVSFSVIQKNVDEVP